MGGYLQGSYGKKARLAIALAAMILIPVYFLPVLPVWQIHLRAPQYPEGLRVTIYANTVGGDLAKVNLLNHYVGMKQISAGDFPEFRVLPLALTVLGLWALVAVLWGRRWFAALGWGLFSLVALVLLVDFARWLWSYGHDLDPHAPIKMGTFTPPLIGYRKMANFHVQSWPHVGGLLLLIAGALGPVILLLEWRTWRRHRRPSQAGLPKGKSEVAPAAALALLCLFAPWVFPLHAEASVVREVGPTAAALRQALADAEPGDTLRLAPTAYLGNFAGTTPVSILGRTGSAIDGQGRGTVLTLSGGPFLVRGLTIRNSGSSLLDDQAGLHLANAPGSLVEDVRFADDLHGIYLERAAGAVVRRATFVGRAGHVSESSNGNAVHLWYSAGVRVENVDVQRHRDGIYVSFCKDVVIRASRFHGNERYGLHYMYSDSNRIEDCRFERNVAGAAIMFSNGLSVRQNTFSDNDDPRAHGLLLRDCSDGVFEENRIERNTVAVFLDNSLRNRFVRNRLVGNAWGLYVFASSTDNRFAANDLVNNAFPLAIDTRRSDNDFRGNYWSGAMGYDLNGDRVSDVPYRPVGLFAFLSKKYPDLALFADSPAIVAVAGAERLLPALSASEVADEQPAMQPRLRAENAGRPLAPRTPDLPLALSSGLLALSGGGALWRLRRS